jgi:plasmid stabilization system protein ParE
MSFRLKILARARADFEGVVAWIAERSPEGAERLTARFEEALATLEENPKIAPVAPESENLGEEVRHVMFRTKAGRTFRAIFLIVGSEVRILRVRGAGQPPLTTMDVQFDDPDS